MQDSSGYGFDGYGQGVWDGVVDGHEFAFEWADLFHVAFFNNHGKWLDAVFGEFGFNERYREFGADDGNIFA